MTWNPDHPGTRLPGDFTVGHQHRPLLDLYPTVIMKNNLMLVEQVGSEVTELDFPLQ
ncbi:MAG: hypothetical protein VB855_05205 [Pirellulaceae bacterium]